MKFTSQKGFTLLEVSIATAIAALGIMATLQMRAAQTQIDAARSVAQVYERLNNAAGSYMTLYYKEIIEKGKTNPGCGQPAYQVPTDGYLDTVVHGTDCQIELEVNKVKKIVKNYLQPKPRELAALGILTASDGNYEDQLPLPSHKTAGGSGSTNWTAHSISNDPSYGAVLYPARDGMAILIQLMCIHPGSNGDFPVVALDTCKSNTYDLRSLVFNIQPYSDLGDNKTLMYRVMEAAGAGRTYLSDTRYGGQLRSDGGVSTLDNPIKLRNTTDGPPHILAIRNGYGSSGQDVFVRRDGSTILKGDWGVGGQSITGINTLAANNLAVTQQVGANSILTNSATVTGALSAGSVSAGSVIGNSVRGDTGVFGNFLGDLRAALNATTAYFSGNVTADGDLSVSGATRLSSNLTVTGASQLNSSLSVAGNTVLTGGTKVADFRLENEAVFGGTCNPGTQTLARASSSSDDYNNSLRLLVCDPSSNTWTRPQADYKSQVQNLTTSLGTVSGSVGSLSGQVEDLKKRKTYVEYTDIQWDPATYIGIEEYTEKGQKLKREVWEAALWMSFYEGRAWKPTPWRCHPNDLDSREANNNSSFWYNGILYKVPFTPPLIFSVDGGADAGQTVVYDVGCMDKFNSNANPPVWHVAVGQKQRNIAGGNNCGSGFGSNLSEFAWRTNQVGGRGYYDKPDPCKVFNIRTPNFNSVEIKARFMVFFNKE